MRTVDPEEWCERFKKPSIRVSRPWRFGRQKEGIEAVLRDSLRDAFREFVTHTSAHGIKYLTDVNSSRPIRYCNTLSIMCLVVWGVLLMTYLNLDFRERPPLQMIPRDPVPVPFPAIAICSNCIISKQAIHAYYSYLESKNPLLRSQNATIMSHLVNFEALITLTRQKSDMEFMRFFYDIHPNFNVTDIMFKLSPKCSSILKRCAWRGHHVECDRLFATRATPLGFCCVFNSRYQSDDVNTPPKILDVVGQNYGLSVAVSENPDDFAAVRRPVDGFDVLLFDGAEYPLLESGAVRMVPIRRNASVYVALKVSAQIPSPTLHDYSEQWRGCRLQSSAWCLTRCRRRAVAALCNCLPFTLLPNRSEPVCAPDHLYCLNKHREKLMYYYPGDNAPPGLDEETKDSQDCQHCAPDCARTLHAPTLHHSVYMYPGKLFRNTVTTGLSMVNTSMVRFFYQTLNHKTYNVEVNLRWYEALATLGCQGRLLLGFSLVAVSELVYHCTIRWCYHVFRRIDFLKSLKRKIRHVLSSRDE